MRLRDSLRSLIQAIQGNFDHLQGTVRELGEAHNATIDDVEVIAEYISSGAGVGPEGPEGPRGPIGFPGEDGEPGFFIPGRKGDTGATGATGPQGPQGDPGPAGADGAGGSGVPYFPTFDEDPWGMPVPPKKTDGHDAGHKLYALTSDHTDIENQDPSVYGSIIYWDSINGWWTLGGAYQVANIAQAVRSYETKPAPGFPGEDGRDGMFIPPQRPNLSSAVYGRNHKGGNQALTGASAWYQVTFGTANEENPSGFFNNAGDDYVITEAGTYTVIGQVTWDIPVTSHTERRVAIYVDGVAVAVDHLTVSSTTDPSSHVVSFTGALAAGASVELWAYSEDGAGAAGYRILGGADETYFNIFKLGGPAGPAGPAGANGAPGADGGAPTPPGLWYPEPNEFGMWVPPGASESGSGGGGVYRSSIRAGTRVWLYTECMSANGALGSQAPGAQPDWHAYSSGTGASPLAGAIVENDHPGIIECATGTTSIGRCAIYGGNGSNQPVMNVPGGTRFGSWIKTDSNLSSSAQRYRLFVGFSNLPGHGTTLPNSGFGFSYTDDENTGKWKLVDYSAAAETGSTDSGITVATSTWYYLVIDVDSDGNGATFYINGANVGRLTTLTKSNASPVAGIGKRVGVTARRIYVDAIWVDIPVNR